MTHCAEPQLGNRLIADEHGAMPTLCGFVSKELAMLRHRNCANSTVRT